MMSCTRVCLDEHIIPLMPDLLTLPENAMKCVFLLIRDDPFGICGWGWESDRDFSFYLQTGANNMYFITEIERG